MDWSKLDIVVFGKELSKAQGFVCIPDENVLHTVVLTKDGTSFKVISGVVPSVKFNVIVR
jgi:hypothetical protein